MAAARADSRSTARARVQGRCPEWVADDAPTLAPGMTLRVALVDLTAFLKRKRPPTRSAATLHPGCFIGVSGIVRALVSRYVLKARNEPCLTFERATSKTSDQRSIHQLVRLSQVRR